MTQAIRIKRVTLRMTFREHENLVKASIENNMNMSQYIRKYLPELKGVKE